MQAIRVLTTATKTSRSNANKLFRERVNSLVSDGYKIVFSSTGLTSSMWFVSLRHQNGNRVTIAVYWDTNRLVQRTNGVIVHESTLY